jgi:Cd2+/Zn2+-exporting ATPase
MGKGATARCLVCENRNGFVGKLEFRENQQAEKIVEQLASQGKTSVVVSFGTGVAGIIGLTDTIKHDSISAIKQLQALISTYNAHGDSETAHYVADAVGIKGI